MARPCTVESLPRTEALLKEGLEMSRALGVRDLRSPRQVVAMEPKSASHFVSTSATIRVALLCGATAALGDEELVRCAAQHARRPKASALAFNALEAKSDSAASVCISISPNTKATWTSKWTSKWTSQRRFRGSEWLFEWLFDGKWAEMQVDNPIWKRQKTATGADTVRVRHILLRHQGVRQAMDFFACICLIRWRFWPS